MKTTIKNLSKVLLVAITIFSMTIISSCSKDGEPGAAGKDGVNGTNGNLGSVNVFYSDWISANFATTNVGSTPNKRLMEISLANVPNTIDINNAVVLVYFITPVSPLIRPLPVFDYDGSKFYFGFNGPIQKIIITAESNSVAPVAASAITGFDTRFRFVIIPKGTLVAARSSTLTNYSKMSYQEICAKFNIPE